jgi:hypothetical protein
MSFHDSVLSAVWVLTVGHRTTALCDQGTLHDELSSPDGHFHADWQIRRDLNPPLKVAPPNKPVSVAFLPSTLSAGCCKDKISTNDRSVISTERLPHIDNTVTV